MIAPLFIIAPLVISAGDRAWIEAIRRDHDPQAGVVEAHVTLVFGVRALGSEEMVAHVGAVARAMPPIAFHLDRAVAVRDETGARSHVFLALSDGAADVCTLHQALYAGPLAWALREDIPFFPHVTVASFADHDAAVRLADGLMERELSIFGALDRLDVVAFDGQTLQRVQSLPLGLSSP